MIYHDIRVHLIVSLLSVMFFAAWFVPDRVVRIAGNPNAEADRRIFIRLVTGVLLFGFMAGLPSFYRTYFTPLPTGPAAAGNFWVWLAEIKAQSNAFSMALLGVYAGLGLAWAVVHFWLYARRLGQLYVMERDGWLRSQNRTSLEGLTNDERTAFNQVLVKVQREMLYDGDFPLQPLQQKRFFIANALLWPMTLAWYLFADMAVDAARYVWFALRNWTHRCWAAGMAEYMNDQALCRGLIVEEAVAQAR